MKMNPYMLQCPNAHAAFNTVMLDGLEYMADVTAAAQPALMAWTGPVVMSLAITLFARQPSRF